MLKYQPELLDELHATGMKVNTWTVNEEPDMRDMLSRGVDGVISNWPDLLVRTAWSMRRARHGQTGKRT